MMKPKRKSFIRKPSKKYQFPQPSDVTEGSLQVWAGLPQKIRQDPSLASFQMEHNRIHGESHDENSDDIHQEEIAMASNEDCDGSSDHSESFITIKVPSSSHQEPPKADEHEISTHPNPPHHTPESHHTPDSHHSPHNIPHNAHFYLHHDDHTNLKEDPVYRKYLKSGFLIICWFTFAILLVMKKDKILTTKTLAVPVNDFKSYELRPMPENRVLLTLEGAFLPKEYTNETTEYLTVALQLVTFASESNDTIGVDEAHYLKILEMFGGFPW